jgi:hypothetical protein
MSTEAGVHIQNAHIENVHVQEVLLKAQAELRQLMHQRVEITRQIGTVKQTISGLAVVFGDDVLNDDLLELVGRKTGGRQRGLTRACRRILMESSRPMTARDVCEQILRTIPSLLSGHKHSMASVATILNRLGQYGEATAVTIEQGGRAWQWAATQREQID